MSQERPIHLAVSRCRWVRFVGVGELLESRATEALCRPGRRPGPGMVLVYTFRTVLRRAGCGNCRRILRARLRNHGRLFERGGGDGEGQAADETL